MTGSEEERDRSPSVVRLLMKCHDPALFEAIIVVVMPFSVVCHHQWNNAFRGWADSTLDEVAETREVEVGRCKQGMGRVVIYLHSTTVYTYRSPSDVGCPMYVQPTEVGAFLGRCLVSPPSQLPVFSGSRHQFPNQYGVVRRR